MYQSYHIQRRTQVFIDVGVRYGQVEVELNEQGCLKRRGFQDQRAFRLEVLGNNLYDLLVGQSEVCFLTTKRDTLRRESRLSGTSSSSRS